MLILASRQLWPGRIPTPQAGPSAPYSRYRTLKGEPDATCLRGHRSPLATASQNLVGSLLATRRTRSRSRSAAAVGDRPSLRAGWALPGTDRRGGLAGTACVGAGGGGADLEGATSADAPTGGGGAGEGAATAGLLRQARQPSRSRPATSRSAAPQWGQRMSVKPARGRTQVNANGYAVVPRRTCTDSSSAGISSRCSRNGRAWWLGRNFSAISACRRARSTLVASAWASRSR